MAITGTYPTTYDAQQEYIANVRDNFKSLEARSGLATVHGIAEPSAAVLAAQWAETFPYSPPKNGANIYWFNPITQKIENVFYPLASGSGDLVPYKRKPTNIGWEYITDVVVGAAGILDTGASYGIPQTYRHLLITWSARSAFAGASVEILGLRFNNLATATHQYIIGFTTSGSTPNISSATTATFGYAGSIPQDSMTIAAQASAGHIIVPNYSISQTPFGIRPYHAWSVGTTNNARPLTKQLIRTQGYAPVLGVITRIQLFATTNTNLQRGSKMTIYGLK